MSQGTNWEADKMLDVYIYDYLLKRKLHASAKAFQAEGKVATDPVAIDAPGGFLFEWWSVFWDIFIARTNEKHSESAASYIETQFVKAREMQQQNQKPQHHQQMQMHQMLLQRHAQQQQQQQQQQLQQQRQQQQDQQQQQQYNQQQQQLQQRRDGNQHLSGATNGFTSNDVTRQNSATASALATKLYEDRLKLPHQDDAALKERLNDNVAQLVDPTHASVLKAAALGGHPSGQTLQNPSGGSGNLQHPQNQNQQLSVSTQDIKTEMNSMTSPRIADNEGSMIGLHGSNQGGDNLTLKGWPLTGLDQLGLLQHQRMMQSPQPLNKFQLQQQLILQAQQNLASPSASDLERRKLRMLLNHHNMGFGKDGPLNSGDMMNNIGSSMQVGNHLLPRGDPDMLLKLQQQQLQNNTQQQRHFPQHGPSSHPSQSQNSNHHLQQQEKTIGSGSLTVDGSISNNFQGNDQAAKNQVGRKRKQRGSSSGPANSSGTANTTGPSPSSPSTPSTHTPGDAVSMPTLSHNGGSSKPMLMFSSDGLGSLASAPNELADIDRFVDDRTLDDNVDSFFSPDVPDPTDRLGQSVDVTKGFTFSEVRHIPASNNKIECCHFSSDGKLLATGGHDNKVTLWCTKSFTVKSSLEEHSQWITDVRFSPGMSRLATSSADKTIRVWDAENPGYSLRTFTGHPSTVLSVDFHPSREDLIFSCDKSEMRYWSIKNGSCAGVTKGGATQIRLQPRMGRILAAAVENIVSIVDVDTQLSRVKLQGHKSNVHSVCWDPSGEYLASVSDDLVRVWNVNSSGKADCVHELNCTGNKFRTCVFHPTHPSLLVVGCYQTLELWNMTQNKTMTLTAHEQLVSGLAVSTVSGLVVSASHDKFIKIWN